MRGRTQKPKLLHISQFCILLNCCRKFFLPRAQTQTFSLLLHTPWCIKLVFLSTSAIFCEQELIETFQGSTMKICSSILDMGVTDKHTEMSCQGLHFGTKVLSASPISRELQRTRNGIHKTSCNHFIDGTQYCESQILSFCNILQAHTQKLSFQFSLTYKWKKIS